MRLTTPLVHLMGRDISGRDLILIVGGLTFFPALALGPIVEHLAMQGGAVF